jgi:hypothetical protein
MNKVEGKGGIGIGIKGTELANDRTGGHVLGDT